MDKDNKIINFNKDTADGYLDSNNKKLSLFLVNNDDESESHIVVNLKMPQDNDSFEASNTDNIAIEASKDLWINKLTNIFKFVEDKEDKKFIYLLMHQMNKELSIYDMADVLIKTITLNDKKTVLLGSAQAIWFFNDCDYPNDFNEKLVSLFGALLDTNNEMVKVETVLLLEKFLCPDLMKRFSDFSFKSKEAFDFINAVWKYC